MPLIIILIILILFYISVPVFMFFSSFLGLERSNVQWILPYILFLFWWIYFLSVSLRVKPEIIKGKIEQYIEGRARTLSSVTFRSIDGERRLFRIMRFPKALFGTVPIEENAIFFINTLSKSQKITCWGYSIPEKRTRCSLEYMAKPPKSKYSSSFFILLCLIVWPLPCANGYARGELAPFLLTVMPVIILYLKVKVFNKLKNDFEMRLKMLDEYNIPHPLA